MPRLQPPRGNGTGINSHGIVSVRYGPVSTDARSSSSSSALRISFPTLSYSIAFPIATVVVPSAFDIASFPFSVAVSLLYQYLLLCRRLPALSRLPALPPSPRCHRLYLLFHHLLAVTVSLLCHCLLVCQYTLLSHRLRPQSSSPCSVTSPRPATVSPLSPSPCSLIVFLPCRRPPVLSIPPAVSPFPCSVNVPLLCHRSPALSKSPCSVTLCLLCQYSPLCQHLPALSPYPCTVLVPPALSSSPYAVIVVLGLSLLPMLCRRPPFPSSSPLLSVHLFRHVPLLRQNCCPKRQPPSAPQLSSLHNDDFLLLRIPADTRTHSSALGSGQAKR